MHHELPIFPLIPEWCTTIDSLAELGANEDGCLLAVGDFFQTIAAKYLYDPYGNTLSMYGSLADANSYRFSSKEWNQNSGLYYYLYRLYDASLQRWLNRDPIEEIGGFNLYNFVKNNPQNKYDDFGLIDNSDCCNSQLNACLSKVMNGAAKDLAPYGIYGAGSAIISKGLISAALKYILMDTAWADVAGPVGWVGGFLAGISSYYLLSEKIEYWKQQAASCQDKYNWCMKRNEAGLK